MVAFVKKLANKNFFKKFLLYNGFYDYLSDEKYIPLFYETIMGVPLDINNPTTFNEKIQWLKLHDRKPEYTQMVDKVGAKDFVEQKLGKEYIIPTLGVWDNADDIDFDKLPNQFVLKCTHDSGGLIICKDKSKLDLKKARKKLNKTLKRDFYKYGREWPYKGVKHRILAEKYMFDSDLDKENLTDYKIFCFDGEPKFVMTVRDRANGVGFAMHKFYDVNWNITDLDLDYRNELKSPDPKPADLDKLLDIARLLSEGTKHLRVDLYVVNGQIYFGEMTFYHMSGLETFVPSKWDKILGEYIKIN